ncbi:MAG: hypothetical protein ACRD23_06380 [Terriglobales bacterium]
MSVAIAAGKNITFPHPSFDSTAYFGTEGGLHNFLHFLENWNGDTMNYRGSLVSLYYSTYNTGTFSGLPTPGPTAGPRNSP